MVILTSTLALAKALRASMPGLAVAQSATISLTLTPRWAAPRRAWSRIVGLPVLPRGGVGHYADLDFPLGTLNKLDNLLFVAGQSFGSHLGGAEGGIDFDGSVGADASRKGMFAIDNTRHARSIGRDVERPPPGSRRG